MDKVVSTIIELTFVAWDLQLLADDIWKEVDFSLRTAILCQWDENVAATGGGHAEVLRPEWAEPPDPDGFPRPPFKWDEERRQRLRAELDGLYAHLYGLTRDEFAYILDTFPIVKRKDEARYGEYRTKRLCLEAYDAIAARPDFEELIPEQARMLQQESVLSVESKTTAISPPARVTTSQATPAAPVPARPAPPVEKPGSPATRPPEARPAAPAPVKKTEPSGQLPLMDYGLYKCLACGKMVLGFDRENHVRQVHQGKAVGWKKMGK